MYEENLSRMTIIEHLEELRKRIIYSLAFFVTAAVFSFMFVDKISGILRLPAIGVIDNFIFTSPTEVFGVYLRLSMLSGFIISLPFILLQLGFFLMPAVAAGKKEVIISWLVLSLALSMLGIIFSYFIALPLALKFLIGFARGAALPMIAIGKYFSFAGAFLLIGAGIFQIPVIMALLTYLGLFGPGFFNKNRKYAIVSIAILAAIITPTQDIFNMLIFGLPMWVLFEAGVVASLIIEKRRKR